MLFAGVFFCAKETISPPPFHIIKTHGDEPHTRREEVGRFDRFEQERPILSLR
jgi:hypothetical protein